MDKSLILNEIKELLKFKTDTEFADFLGIKQNTLSSWRTRNSIDYDLIISKCDFLDANWLLTGKGSMLKNEEKKEVSAPIIGQNASILEQENAFLKKDIQRLEEQIKDKDKIISTLESNQKLLQEKLSAYEKSHNFAIATQSATRPAL